MIEQLEEVIKFTEYGDFIQQDEFVIEHLEEYDFLTLEANEKAVLGFNLFVNPLNNFTDYIAKHQLKVPSTIEDDDVNQEVKFVGILTSIRKIKTKNQKEMAFITIQDEYIKLSGVLFTFQYNQYKDILVKGTVYLCKGKIELRGNERQVVISNLHALS